MANAYTSTTNIVISANKPNTGTKMPFLEDIHRAWAQTYTYLWIQQLVSTKEVDTTSTWAISWLHNLPTIITVCTTRKFEVRSVRIRLFLWSSKTGNNNCTNRKLHHPPTASLPIANGTTRLQSVLLWWSRLQCWALAGHKRFKWRSTIGTYFRDSAKKIQFASRQSPFTRTTYQLPR